MTGPIRQKAMLRCLVPLFGLALLALFAALYTVDPEAYYRSIATLEGASPFKYPFIDWGYITAGIKCWREGIDVYIVNPCDVLGRTHIYSPLWLRAVFIPTDRAWMMPIGLVLVLAFVISLFWLVKPINWRELVIIGLACTSPMVFFALERGNIDIIIFIMAVVAGVLSTGPWASRILSYAILLLAGLLKFYPLIALSAALRERPRTCLAIVAASGLVIIGFSYRFREELVALWGKLPDGGFASVNLPFDGAKYALQLFPGLGQFVWFTALPYVIMAVLLIVTAGQVIHLARDRNLASAFAKVPERDAMFLVIGAAFIAGCFFTGHSNGYRGIHLIFVVTGLIGMRRVTDNPTTRAMLTRAIMIVLLLMWEALVRQALPHKISGPGLPGLALSASALFWLIREVLWWRLAALLLGMLGIFGFRMELFAAVPQWSRLQSAHKSIPTDNRV